MQHYFFVVEGPHDAAAVGKVLRLMELKEIKRQSLLSEVWQRTIPEKYPFNEDKLDRIAPLPEFYQNENISIAVKTAMGVTEIINTLDYSLGNLEIRFLTKINGIAIFCDADEKTAVETTERLLIEIDKRKDICFDRGAFKNKSGLISGVNMKTGIYVFPNNVDKGTLEDLLLERAEEVYPEILLPAKNYIEQIGQEHKKHWSMSAEKKVLFGCMANVLRPGKSNQIKYLSMIMIGFARKCGKHHAQFSYCTSLFGRWWAILSSRAKLHPIMRMEYM